MESFSLLYGGDACKQAKLFFLVWNVGTVGVCNYSVFSLQRWHSTYSHFQDSLLLLLNISCLQQHHHHFMYEWVAFGNFFLSSSSSSYYVYDGKDMIIEQSKKEKNPKILFWYFLLLMSLVSLVGKNEHKTKNGQSFFHYVPYANTQNDDDDGRCCRWKSYDVGHLEPK